MIEGLTNVMTPNPQTHASASESDETMESVALAGVDAIQRLIAIASATARIHNNETWSP